jgi:hypothetical protein
MRHAPEEFEVQASNLEDSTRASVTDFKKTAPAVSADAHSSNKAEARRK